MGGGPDGGGGSVCSGSIAGAGVLLGDTMKSTGDCGLVGDEQGERSVTGVRSACDCGVGEPDVSCAVVSIVSLVRDGDVVSIRKKTLGEAGRPGGERSAGRMGFGGRSIDCMRSFFAGSSYESTFSTSSSGADRSSGELSGSCMILAMSSGPSPACDPIGA